MKICIKKLFLLCFAFLITFSLSAQFYTEDFGNQIEAESNWTSGGINAGSEVWHWTDDPANPVFDAQPPFGATTALNGFFQFDSDLNDPNPFEVTLTGPAIDCSEHSTVIASFQNQYAYDFPISTVLLGVSTDGDEFNYYSILQEVGEDDLFEAVQNVVVDISEHAAKKPTVYLRFKWIGEYEYAWKIDDIMLSTNDPTLPHDLAIHDIHFAPNYFQPSTQKDEVHFQMYLDNNGTSTQTGVIAKASVWLDETNIFTTTVNLNDIPVGTSDSLIVFPDSFIPIEDGEYTLRYSVTQDSTDATSADNVITEEFTIGGCIFSKDNGDVFLSYGPDEDDNWEIGNHYYTPNAGLATLAIWSIDYDEPLQGETVNINLYKIINIDADIPEVSLVGQGEHVLSDEAPFDAIVTDLYSVSTQTLGVDIEAESEYFLMIEYGPEMKAPFSPTLSYPFQVASVVKISDEWILGGLGSNKTVVARLGVDCIVGTNEVELSNHAIDLFPNPVSDVLFLSIDLKEMSKKGTIRIVDTAGRLFYKTKKENIKSEIVEIDIAEFPPGAYFLHLSTDDGVRTERFVRGIKN